MNVSLCAVRSKGFRNAPWSRTFSATVVLQRLALVMSVLKKNYLDRLGIADHGVHPDVPKNVSKSITVD